MKQKEIVVEYDICFRDMDESLRGTVGKLLVGTEARVFYTHLHFLTHRMGLFYFPSNSVFLCWSKIFEIFSFSSDSAVKVEDLESRQLVEPGQPGELLIRGPQVQKTLTETKTKEKTITIFYADIMPSFHHRQLRAC